MAKAMESTGTVSGEALMLAQTFALGALVNNLEREGVL